MDISDQHAGIYCRNIGESIKFYQDVFGFDLLFESLAMEGDKPLKMAWMRHPQGMVVELLEQEDKAPLDATACSLNHLAFRVPDMDAAVAHLLEHGVEIEAGPFDPPLDFDRPCHLEGEVFETCSEKGLNMRICFFRGPGNERFEMVQDNISGL